MSSEAEILQNLFSSWIRLALEYADGASDVRAIYFYASSEQGSTFANIYFNQNDTIIHPGRLSGGDVSLSKLSQVQDLLVNDLFDAEDALQAISVKPPTEYKVYFEPATRKLDVQLSRDLIYSNDPNRIPEHGIEYWLGDRAPKLY